MHCGTLKLPRNPDVLGGGALEQGGSEASELMLSSETFFFFGLVSHAGWIYESIHTTLDGVDDGDTLPDRAQLMGRFAAPQWYQPSATDYP